MDVSLFPSVLKLALPHCGTYILSVLVRGTYILTHDSNLKPTKIVLQMLSQLASTSPDKNHIHKVLKVLTIFN